MKETREYKNWQSIETIDLLSRELSNRTIVWFPELCPDQTSEPTDCSHNVAISFKEFTRNYSDNIEICYHTEKPIEDSTALLNHKTAKISLFTALLVLFGWIITTVTKDSVASGGIAKHESCECETEDISVGDGNEKVRFKVVYLSQEKTWEFESSSKLTNGQTIEQFLSEYLPKVPNFEKSIGLIAVGLASEEGDRKMEEKRARERADEILASFRVISLSSLKELYKLNLGQFSEKTGQDKNETAYQRRIIVIGIMEKDENMKVKLIRKQLKIALENSEGLNFDTKRYSEYDFGKY